MTSYDNWFMDHWKALHNLGLTNEEEEWLKSMGIGISTQYLGLLRIYVGKNAQEKLEETSVVQIGSILDSISDNVLCLEHRQGMVDTLRRWIADQKKKLVKND